MTETPNDAAVLVIDDDPDFRTLVAAFAELCHVVVLQADNCTDGIHILKSRRQHIKMILLDYMMPGMKPPQCVAAIRAEAGPLIPIILMTAAHDPASRAAELNITRWISKPFDASTLINVLTT